MAAAIEAETAAGGKDGAGDAEAGGAGTAADAAGLLARPGAPRMILGTRSSAPSR